MQIRNGLSPPADQRAIALGRTKRTLTRIMVRAIDRVGEILKSIETAKTGPKLQDGTVPQSGRTQAARDAGLSERQRKTALRVASVPRDEFIVSGLNFALHN